ncbi:hypothetical protein WR25_17597 [Diploscapter pachys]|uniref:C6 domain-containing protein n=1 Tax=Diploscapter pachys TaxID=2018661 RepID=A0A2A2JAL7_9BILA|nr:hypothetical protein WR25_17597 [Diploscapter pachys]
MRYNQLIIFCLFILLYGVEFASCGTSCSTTGVWGEWGPWTECPNTGDPTWDFITRQRECMPTPTGCTQMEPFSCPGKYSEVEFCNTTPAPVVTIASETSTSQEEQTTPRIVDAATSPPIVQETSPSGSEENTSPVGGSSEGNVATSPANSPTSAANSGSSPDSGNGETSPAEASATSPSAQETPPAAEGSSAQASGSSVPASGGNTSPAPSATDGNVDTSPAQSGSSPEPEGSSPSGQGSSPQDSGSSQAAQETSPSGSGEESSPMPGSGSSPSGNGETSPDGNSESSPSEGGESSPMPGSGSSPSGSGETSPDGNSGSSPSGGGESSPSGSGEESSPMPGSGSSPSGNGETSPDGNSGSSPSGASESSPSGSENSGAPTGDSGVSGSGSETSPMPDGNSGAPSGSSAAPGNSEPSATGQSEASQITGGGSSVPASGETSPIPASESSYASEGPRGSVEPGNPPTTTTTMKPGSGTTAPKTTKADQGSGTTLSSTIKPNTGSGSETTHSTTTATMRTQDPQSSVTTSFVAIVCDNCNDLNVYLYKDQPYQDGASVLNRYTSSGCKFVQFFCRPIDWSDSSTVRTVFNKNPNATAPLNANIQCMNGKWYDEENHTEISSLSCIYDQNEDSVTTSATTLSPTSTTKGPLSESVPIIDHNIPCQNCSQLVVNPQVDQAGSATLNFELGDCLTVDVFCQPVGNFTTVDLLFDGVSIGLSGSTVNRTFTCNNATQWVDVTTGQIVMNIACAMVNSSTSTVAPPPTTPATLPIVTEDPLSACDKCPNVIAQPLNETNYYNGMLVLDHYNQTSKCRVVDMTCQGTRPTEYTALIINSYYFISVGTGVQELTVTCSSSGTWLWDGLDITTASCILTDSSTQPIPNNMSTLPPTAAPATMPTTTAVTLAPGQTTPDPAIVACNSCSRLPVISNGVNNFENGFTILQNGNNGQCIEVAVTCQGESSTESVAIVSGANILESSQGSVQMNLTCNEFHVWTSPDGIVIDSISCSVVRERTTALLPTTPTTIPSTSTLPSTTTTTTTTTIPLTTTTTTAMPTTTTTTPLTTTTTTAMPTTTSLCSSCPNMEALSIPSPNDVDTNGQLLLDHYIQSLTNCRTVVIKCSGPDTYHNATILYNGVMDPSMMITSPGQISTSLVCDSTGQWPRLGKSITGVACLVQALPNGATLPPVVPTTSAPEITVPVPTGTTACASCSRSLVTSVPSGYQGAFLTMDSSFNPCLSVQLSCSAPDHVSAVSILSSTGLLLSTSNGMTNLTISCSDSAQWVTQFGTAITGISCGIIAPTTIPATTTTTLSTLPTTLTTLLTQATTTTLQPSQGTGGCESSYWAEWQEWSSCTDDCGMQNQKVAIFNPLSGSCGTWQRFRACNKAMPDCLCSGTAYEKVPCNRNVCKYPRTPSCCAPYTPQSGSNGVFQCLSPPTD